MPNSDGMASMPEMRAAGSLNLTFANANRIFGHTPAAS